MKLVIVSGLSGAGKSVALREYEDLGWYCVDNLPLDLVEPLVSHAMEGDVGLRSRYERVAMGVDARAHPEEIERFPRFLAVLRERGVRIEVLFLVADDAVLLKRYNETRRRHPLSGPEVSLPEAIVRERILLAPIANAADAVLDTSRLNLHELRATLADRQPNPDHPNMTVMLLSFGFKNGVPVSADFVFDVRCLPNPHWVPELRALTGRDALVQNWFSHQADVASMTRDLSFFLETWLPKLQQQDRAYATIAIGCTGGQHRSVYIAERVAAKLRLGANPIMVKHRELS